jgi:hypothetical protein
MSQYWGTARWGTVQNVSYTGTAGTTTNGATNGIQKVRLLATTDCYVKVSAAGTAATSSDTYLPALSAEYLTITSGEKVSAIQVASAGTLNVTECP